MSDAQRIFYFHVPSAWIGFLAFGIVFVVSLLYLWKRERRWDALALSAAEIGVVFTTLVLLTGPLWAKKAWGAFWVWDVRLTTTLVLWMIYIGYLMLRSTADSEHRSRFAAVLAIVGCQLCVKACKQANNLPAEDRITTLSPTTVTIIDFKNISTVRFGLSSCRVD